jgi:hypothetical protein
MRLSSLCLAAVLVCSAAAFAQHSSGGGGSSGGSSGGSGGGSHSSSGGSTAGSSTSSHGSGGSAAHGSSTSHGASGHNSSSASSHSSAHLSRSSPARTKSAPGAGVRAKSGRRNFFSFLRRPFRKPEPKTDLKPKIAADLRRPICFKGPCLICPAGHANGVCAGLVVDHKRNLCSTREIWGGGACLLQTSFLDDCSGMRLALEQQAQRMQAAEEARQSACSAGSREECSDRAGAAQSETSLYGTLQERYRKCRRRSLNAYPFGGLGSSSHSPGLLFERLGTEVNYR